MNVTVQPKQKVDVYTILNKQLAIYLIFFVFLRKMNFKMIVQQNKTDNITKAVVPIAGNGFRMAPISNIISKELLPILNKPSIELIIEELIEANIQLIIFISNPGKVILNNYIIKFIDDKYPDTKYKFFMQNEPLGLGDAIMCSKNGILNNEYFLIVLPDNLFFLNSISKEMVSVYKREKKPVVSLSRIHEKEINKRAIVSLKPNNNSKTMYISSILDKPTSLNIHNSLAISGRYIISDEIFKYIKKENHFKEIEFTNALNVYCKNNDVIGKEFDIEKYDIGSYDGYYKAFIEIGKTLLNK